MPLAPYQLRVEGTDLVKVEGSFTAEATGPTVEDVKGFGVTVAYGGSTGVYTLTLANKYPLIQNVMVSLPAVVGTANTVVGYTWSYVASTGVITVTFVNASGAATAPADESQINFSVTAQVRSILGNGQ